MDIDLTQEWIFETNDFSNMKTLDFFGTKLFYMDNFYKYPELVFKFFNSTTPPIWKEWEKPSRNTIDFEDRRHMIGHKGMSNVYKKLSELCGEEPLDYTEVVTNYTRFKKCPNNNYEDYYWWPHNDSGYNGIVYFNDFDGKEYEGTYLYIPKNEEEVLASQLNEHQEPWTLKNEWEILLKIKAKYNRFVMFDGFKYWHGMHIHDDTWFADKFEDANYRINQVLFFVCDEAKDRNYKI
jgi:hypothetical protein